MCMYHSHDQHHSYNSPHQCIAHSNLRLNFSHVIFRHHDVMRTCRDEFTNFMFLEKVQAGSADSATENWRLFPQEFRDKNESSSYHHDQVRHIACSAWTTISTGML